MKFLSPIITLFLSWTSIAQTIETTSFIGLDYKLEQQEGTLRYNQFHQYDPTNPQLRPHVHWVYNSLINSVEKRGNVNLKAQYSLDERINVGVVVPYSFNSRITDALPPKDTLHNYSTSGVGDIQLYFASKFVEWISENDNFEWAAYGKAGIEFKTGKFYNFGSNGELNADMQVGSKSTDYFLEVATDITFKNFVIEIAGEYKWNNFNYYKWKFGNIGVLKTNIYYEVELPFDIRLIPLIGAKHYWIAPDQLGEWYIFNNPASVGRDTGGNFLWLTPTLKVIYKNLAFSFTYNVLIRDKKNGYQPKRTNFAELGLAYYFNKK